MMLNARPDLKDQLNRDQVTDGEMMFASSSGVHSNPIVVNTDAARRESIRLEVCSLAYLASTLLDTDH